MAASDDEQDGGVPAPTHARTAGVSGTKRAPLPQWWWDQTVRTRRIIFGVVVALFVGGVVGLVVVALSSSGEPEAAETQTMEEQRREAEPLVASLPAERVEAWDALAECESEGDWGKATGNGLYGGLQFTQATWIEFGGAGSPHETTREVQIMIAERVQAAQGWGAWPACSSQVGL